MNYQEFVTLTGERANLPFEEAEVTARSVMCALAEVIPSRQAEAIRGCLPAELAGYLERCRPDPDPLLDDDTFLGWVVSGLDTTGSHDKTLGGVDLTAVYGGEEACRRCRCVLAVLKSCLGETSSAALADDLPDWMCDCFREA